MDYAVAIVFAMISLSLAFMIHEYAHGYMAYMLGDPTPKYNGRLSLNPLVHLDPVGAIVMLVTLLSGKVVMGWAKPVQFDESNLKNPKVDGAIIAFAGPFSNYVVVLLVSLIFHLGVPIGALGTRIIAANLGFGLFNCLPLPPLDGWKILRSLMPDSIAASMQRIEQKLGVIGVILVLIIAGTVVNPYLTAVFSYLMAIFASP